MKTFKCVWLEPTAQVQLSLRRTHQSTERRCTHPGNEGKHTIAVVLHNELRDIKPKAPDQTDSRWPRRCHCGFPFHRDDEWKLESEPLYLRTDTTALITLKEAPIGAMWDAYWLRDRAYFKTVDAICLMIRTPAGDWAVDGPSYHEGVPGKGWARYGTVRSFDPTVTVRPEVIQNGFRGWVTSGMLCESNAEVLARLLTNAENQVR